MCCCLQILARHLGNELAGALAVEIHVEVLLLSLERFADKSAQKLIESIQDSKKISFSRFIIALGIPHVGTVTATDLARKFKNINKLCNVSIEDLDDISGIGDKVATEIYQYLNDKHTQILIDRYLQVGIKIKTENLTGKLENKTFIFTGSMTDMTRDEAKQIVQSLGGKVSSSVGSNVDYVIVGEQAGSKEKKAKELGLTILTAEQFKQMIKE
jgi:DNA ligase (NAD+)